MSLQWRDAANVLRTAGAVYLRTADGTNLADRKSVDQIRLRTADGTNPADLKEVYKAGIRLAVSPGSAYGFSSAKTGPITSGGVIVSVAGGTPPYTHLWTATSGIAVDSPNSYTTSFHATPPAITGEIDGFGTDHVTDANGLTNSITVDITIQRG